MKVLICTNPGVFDYKEVTEQIPGAGQALIKIKRVGICGTDIHAFKGVQPFFAYPRILGHEIAADFVGCHEPLGFSPGEPVTIIPYFNCGTCIACRNGKANCCTTMQVCGVHTDGGMSEYLCVPSYALVKSSELNYDELVLVEPLSIGAHGVRRANVKKDEFVLVIGAGPIGLATMEFARIAGGKVIAMDINEARLDFCKEKLRVDYTINAAVEDVVFRLKTITNGDMPAVVMDATGSQKAINKAFQYVAHGGRYVLIGLQMGDISFSHPEFHRREVALMSSRNATRDDFAFVIDSIRTGLIFPSIYLTHRVKFDGLKDGFETFGNPASGVIKAIVEFD